MAAVLLRRLLTASFDEVFPTVGGFTVITFVIGIILIVVIAVIITTTKLYED